MVSTQSTQYITDFTPTTAEPGKSPLALLAKTCETIGLPEGSSKKNHASASSSSSSPHEKKDEKRGIEHKQKSSPRSTPQSKEPTLTFPGLPKPSFPMGMPQMGFPFFNPMMMNSPYQMPFPGFPMGGYMGANRLPCPFAMMRQPCMNPACMQCKPSTSSKTNQVTPDMMSQFAAHPLFSMYAGMMPNMTGVPTSSYQSLLAASAASSMANDVSSSKPSTSTASEPKASKPASKPKFQCSWVDSDSKCGKSFEEESELNAHVKKMHTPSPASSASSEQSSSTGKASRSATATPHRFNPYGKPTSSSAPVVPNPLGMNMSMNPLVLPFSFQAMYANRLMPTVAHQ